MLEYGVGDVSLGYTIKDRFRKTKRKRLCAQALFLSKILRKVQTFAHFVDVGNDDGDAVFLTEN